MTQLERFKATMAHEAHEGLLYYASFTPDLQARVFEEFGVENMGELADQVGMFSRAHVRMHEPDGYEAPDFSGYFEDEEMPEGAYINSKGVLNIPGSMYHFTRYISPLRNAQSFEELEAFPYPSVEGFQTDHMAAAVDDAHAAGRVVCGSIGHMYEDAWQIRDYESFLMDMVLRPEWCEIILDRLKERNKALAVAAATAGADYLHTGDDVANQNAMMFSVDQWRRFMKSRWAEVYAAAREIKPDIQIWYHSDGNIEEIIPELIDIGVTILNPVQPECLDPVMVKEKYGDQIVIDGAIGTQSTMPFGTPDDVRQVIRERAENLGKDGAYIISPTHVLEPEVSIENIRAFFETAGKV